MIKFVKLKLFYFLKIIFPNLGKINYLRILSEITKLQNYKIKINHKNRNT